MFRTKEVSTEVEEAGDERRYSLECLDLSGRGFFPLARSISANILDASKNLVRKRVVLDQGFAVLLNLGSVQTLCNSTKFDSLCSPSPKAS
jgi:hypothetical protein